VQEPMPFKRGLTMQTERTALLKCLEKVGVAPTVDCACPLLARARGCRAVLRYGSDGGSSLFQLAMKIILTGQKLARVQSVEVD
jgi:hypothetical protein